MSNILSSVRLILVFGIVISMLSLSGAVSNSLRIPLVRATPAPCPTHGSGGACSEYWMPAGPAMDSERATVFTDSTAQFTCLVSSNPCVDLTDTPVPPNLPPALDPCLTTADYCTQPVAAGSFAYLSNWQRVVNDENVGIPNSFTWLGAYSPNPAIPGTIRQGFSQSTTSVNPYVASTVHDFYIVGNIYDTLAATNPLNGGQLVDWTTITSSPSPIPNSMLGYSPPAGTVGTFRFTLRTDLYFQDGRPVTSFDVAFSYLSLKANGAFQASGASHMTGITLLGPHQFDLGLNSTTSFSKSQLTSISILPGRYWTAAGSNAWDTDLSPCAIQSSTCYPSQYILGPTPPSGPPSVQCPLTCHFPASDMNADPTKTTAIFDPLAAGILIGSGPWACVSSSGVVGSSCSSSGTENPPVGGSYSLTRFGKGFAPAPSPFDTYFRSAGNLALYAWSGDTGDFTHDFINFAHAIFCFNKTGGTCTPLESGIGSANGIIGPPAPVGINQILIIARFVGVNWISPYDWISAPPTGIIPFPPVLYEGGVTLNPCNIDPIHGYDC